MKRNIKFRGLPVIGMLLLYLFLPSCIADDLSDCPQSENPSPSLGETKIGHFAFQLMSADGSSITTNWDSDDNQNSNTTDNTASLDKGTTFERALYFPNQADDSEDEDSENLDPLTRDDEVDTSSQFYHFAIIFKSNGSLVSSSLVPLDLSFKSDSEKDVTVYGKIYSTDENPFASEDESEITALVVLNASWDLQEKLQGELAKITSPSSSDFDHIRKLTVTGNSTDPETFLSLKDKNGKYITDKAGNPYFTMSSSMVINSNKVLPAIETTTGQNNFAVYPTQEEAEANPTKIYVERLAAKYTVIFKNNNSYYYLKGLTKNTVEIEEETFRTRASSESGSVNDPIGTEHLLFDMTGTSHDIKYVEEYTRNQNITQREKPEIKTSDEWRVNILGWDVNGNETEEYIFKVLNTNNIPYFTNWDKLKVGNNLQSYSYRNFWAEDPHYSTGDYPWQRRKVYKGFTYSAIDQDGEGSLLTGTVDNAVKAHESMTSPTLNYYNFSNLSKRDIRRYIAENTFNQALMSSQGQDPYYDNVYLRTGSHLIVTAQLLIKGIDTDYLWANIPYDSETGMILSEGNAPAASKYYMNDIYWSEQAYKEYIAEYLAYFMMDDYDQQQIFGRNNGNFYVFHNGGMSLAQGTDFQLVSANVKGGDNFVHIMPADGVVLYTYNPDEETNLLPGVGVAENENDDPSSDDFTEIPAGYHAISTKDFLNLVYEYPELMAAHYNAGRMYYVSGSIHNLDNYGEGYTTVATGDYGTVRNNWYAFKIDEISTPGVGVDLADQPIVPNTYDRKALTVGFSILPWHEIYTSVDTSGQNRPGK